jgi:hypothetical protein
MLLVKEPPDQEKEPGGTSLLLYYKCCTNLSGVIMFSKVHETVYWRWVKEILIGKRNDTKWQKDTPLVQKAYRFGFAGNFV